MGLSLDIHHFVAWQFATARLQVFLQAGLGILVHHARPGRLQSGSQQIQDQGAGRDLAAEYETDLDEEMGPIQVIGSGATINDATENAFDRAGTLLDMSEGEVRSRCTFTGGVQIGRLPGVVQLDMLAPLDRLEARGLDSLVREQYDLE